MSFDPGYSAYPNPEAEGSVTGQDTVRDVTTATVAPQSPEAIISQEVLRNQTYDFAFPEDYDTEGEHDQPGLHGHYIEFLVKKFEGSTFRTGTDSKRFYDNTTLDPGNVSAIVNQVGDFFIGLGSEFVEWGKEVVFQDIAGVEGWPQFQSDYITGGRKASPPLIKLAGSIRLFLPLQIQEQFSPLWHSTDVFEGGSAWEQGGVAWLQQLQRAFDTAGSDEIMGRYLSAKFASAALPELATRGEGVAVNNHLEHFFKGLGFRKFTYTFAMAPKSLNEAQEIEDIVRAFKVSAAPELADQKAGLFGRYWVYPNVFEIKYHGVRAHKIGTCALDSVQVNYSGAPTNQTFKGGYPLQTDLTLNFTEMELMHKHRMLSAEDGGGY